MYHKVGESVVVAILEKIGELQGFPALALQSSSGVSVEFLRVSVEFLGFL